MDTYTYASAATKHPAAPSPRADLVREDVIYLNSVLAMMRRHGITKSDTRMLLNYAARPDLLEPDFPRRKVLNPQLIRFTGRAVIVNEAALDRTPNTNIYR